MKRNQNNICTEIFKKIHKRGLLKKRNTPNTSDPKHHKYDESKRRFAPPQAEGGAKTKSHHGEAQHGGTDEVDRCQDIAAITSFPERKENIRPADDPQEKTNSLWREEHHVTL